MQTSTRTKEDIRIHLITMCSVDFKTTKVIVSYTNRITCVNMAFIARLHTLCIAIDGESHSSC